MDYVRIVLKIHITEVTEPTQALPNLSLNELLSSKAIPKIIILIIPI